MESMGGWTGGLGLVGEKTLQMVHHQKLDNMCPDGPHH